MRRLLRERYLGPVDRELYALIAERRDAPDLAERDDILSMLLLARDEEGEPMSDVELRDELMTLLGRPRDDGHVAGVGGRAPRAPSRRPGAPGGRPAYADAVVKEILRLRPVVALVLRRLLEPLEVGGHELPAGADGGARASCSCTAARTSTPSPRPSAPSASSDRAPGTYSWIPFGGGVRRCLGAAFAQVEMQVVLQTLAESVRLEAVGGAEAVRRRGITLAPARGGQVRALAAR